MPHVENGPYMIFMSNIHITAEPFSFNKAIAYIFKNLEDLSWTLIYLGLLAGLN